MVLTTISTGTRDPFDTDAIANFQAGTLGACAKLDDLSYTFMTTNLAGLSGKREHAPLVYIRTEMLGFAANEDLQYWS